MVYSKEKFNTKKIDQLIHTKVMGRKLTKSTPTYSVNVSQAMKVQARMANLGYCCFSLKADYTYCYLASFTNESNHSTHYSIEVEDSPSLAICLAALLARGISVEAVSKSKKR
jgi:hypothetical protein